MKQSYRILSEPQHAVYRRLLVYATHECIRFSLVVRDTERLLSSGLAVIENLSPHLLSSDDCMSWPGTTLLGGHSATVSQFRLTRESADILCAAADGLYSWTEPALPEDLCLYRSDESVWMSTTSHEQLGSFEVSATEYESLLQAIPEMRELSE